MLRIIFCGDRKWNDSDAIRRVAVNLRDNFDFTMIQGMAPGADTLSGYIALQLGIICDEYYAHWNHHYYHNNRCPPGCRRPMCPEDCREVTGPTAGIIRNTRMRVEGRAQGVCAFHPFLLNSKGTKNMVEQSVKANIPVWTYEMGIPALLPFILSMKKIEFAARSLV